MKIISIIQPWATLIALGEKEFETRSWRTKYRGEIAIHASKKIDKALCRCEPFRSILAKHGYTADTLPTGAILATAKLTDCLRVNTNTGTTARLEDEFIISGNELYFGNYSEGRFAWELQDVKPLETPIPAKGQLGLWEYKED